MTLNVQAGDILTINWQMRTNDVAGDFVGGMDLFFLTVNDSVFRLGTSSDALQASTGNYSFETGAKQSTYTFNTAGTYTIGLGVVDMTDYANSSELVLDGVSVTTVPEPSTYALVLGSLGVFASSRSAAESCPPKLKSWFETIGELSRRGLPLFVQMQSKETGRRIAKRNASAPFLDLAFSRDQDILHAVDRPCLQISAPFHPRLEVGCRTAAEVIDLKVLATE